MKKTVIRTMGLLCAGALLMSGCSMPGGGGPLQESSPQPGAEEGSGSEEGPGSEAGAGEETPSPAPQEKEENQYFLDPDTGEPYDEAAMDLIKYNIYVDLNNCIVDVMEDVDYYYSAVDFAEEFAMLEDAGLDYGYEIRSISTDPIYYAEKVTGLKPEYEELDALTEQILESMRPLVGAFNDIQDLADGGYTGKNLSDSAGEKAREYHQVVWQYAEEFYTLAYSYMDAMGRLADARIQEEEAQMLAEGRVITYNASHIITLARSMLDMAQEQGVSDENLTDLDLTGIEPLFEELTAAIDAFEEGIKDDAQVEKEGISSLIITYSLRLDYLKSGFEAMIRQVKSGEPLEDPSAGDLGSLSNIYEKLSYCVDSYNSLFVG